MRVRRENKKRRIGNQTTFSSRSFTVSTCPSQIAASTAVMPCLSSSCMGRDAIETLSHHFAAGVAAVFSVAGNRKEHGVLRRSHLRSRLRPSR